MNLTTPPSKVLIGQRDVSILRRLESFFHGSGYETIVAWASDEAIEVARAGGLALGVFDAEFPREGGIEVVRIVSRLVERIPCILMARIATKESQMAALDAGAVTVLENPFTDETLRVAVDRVFGPRWPLV